MIQTRNLVVLVWGLGLQLVSAGVYKMCTDDSCQDCPVGITNAGTGYPNCVTYDSENIFPNQGFPGSEGGGWKAYVDIPQLDQGCKIIVKSPAHTDLPGCGYMKASFGQPTCALLSLEKTFMVQFCCGTGDCTAAGAERMRRSARLGSRGWGEPIDLVAASDGIYSLVLRDINGTEITPAHVGTPGGGITAVRQPQPNTINPGGTSARGLKAKRSCDEKSWKADEGMAEYSRPADNTQIVWGEISGPSEITIVATRSQSYTTSMNIGFADILSLGVGFEMTETVQDSTEFSFQVPAGQTGKVGFTSYLQCTRGTGKCDGNEVRGEICTPKTRKKADGSVTLTGIFALIVQS